MAFPTERLAAEHIKHRAQIPNQPWEHSVAAQSLTSYASLTTTATQGSRESLATRSSCPVDVQVDIRHPDVGVLGGPKSLRNGGRGEDYSGAERHRQSGRVSLASSTTLVRDT